MPKSRSPSAPVERSFGVTLLVPRARQLARGGLSTTASTCPFLDLRPKPQAGAARAQVDHWARHVQVAALVGTDAFTMREAEQIGDPL